MPNSQPPVPRDEPITNDGSGASPDQPSSKPDPNHYMPTSLPEGSPTIYLWLCCEGWVRFGPFGWLRFQDDPRSIVDQAGRVLAHWEGHCWRTSDPQYSDFQWHNPTITSKPRHPHASNSNHPRYSPKPRFASLPPIAPNSLHKL